MSALSFATLQDGLAAMAGRPDHSFCDEDVRLLSLSAALVDSDKKARLRMFEAVGDNAISMAVASRCLRGRCTPQTYQEVRSVVTSNAKLAEVFVASGLSRFVSLAAGVSPTGKAGANAFEAFAGLIQSELGTDAVMAFCVNSGLFNSYANW